ncbi:MAG TPA: hypothetical protein VFD43_00500, partial [Planctomycetota bacterium]|nr:hypothetical protein [Planctomycetota bacterium]
MRKLLLAIVLACAAPAAASADLIVVDAAGGGDFTDLPAAIDAAQPGDLLLLRPGSYSGHGFMNSKPLDIVADGPDGSVRVVSLWRIFNLTAGESLVIRGLAFDEAPFELSNSVGPVRVEDCSFDGKDQAPLFPNGWPAASLLNCSAVSFVRCADVRGGDGSDGNLGLWIRESQFALLSTAVHGGRGVSYGAEQHGAGGDGGPAVALFDGSSLVAVGGSITGGEGGSGGVLFDPPFAYPGGDGGIGLLLDSPADAATLREVTLAGGAGGFSLSRPGLPGDPLSAPPGTVALDPETSRHFQCSSVVRPGQSVSLAFGGQPGETVLL